MNEPLVTIIAVCYNQEKFVAETLSSILHQTYKNIQLIVADDGSADNSKFIIRDWIEKNNPQAIFIEHKKNLGLTKNINSAIPYVKGEYFQIFGCDDLMRTNKISRQVSFLEQNKNWDIVYTDMMMMDESGNSMEKSYYEKHTYKKPFSGDMYAALIERFIIAAPSVLIRRKVLTELKSYDESLDYEDHDFFLRAAKRSRFYYMPEITVEYRVSPDSLTATHTSLKFFRNSFIIFCKNFDDNKKYKSLFMQRLLFYTKNLYHLKFKHCSLYFFKAFLKTHSMVYLKYSVASVPFYFVKNPAQ